MKISNIKYMAIAALAVFGATSCDDFLDRPTEDSYNVDNFYANDDQCNSGVFYLYNSPWSDFTRGGIIMTETMVGNIYQSQSPYLDFSVNGSDNDLVFMYESLWQVNAHCNTVYNNLKNATCSEATRAKCMGECLTLKAMAYFYLVRAFGDVPIVHDNQADLEGGDYNNKHKVQKADVYEYIIMTLEKAIELLPETNDPGRIDKYCAEGLLAKVYLTRAGVTGTLNADDLAKAAQYAKDVIDNSGRHLLENYSDVFRLQNNNSEESLIGLRWYGSRQVWTAQNFLQSSLAMVGFDEFGDCWGGWTAPSVNLQDAFGVNVLQDPATRVDPDTRRKATMMLPGDVYEYFWTDKGGFDYLKFMYDTSYGVGGPGELQSNTGSNCVKHLYGNSNDHYDALGYYPESQANGLATHLLRLSDVYLVYAEAMIGTGTSTSDPSAIDAYWQVRHRGRPGETQAPASITWEDVWNERMLELAHEGDRWYDYVRLSYYNPQSAIDRIRAQRRDAYYGLGTVYEQYYESGEWTVNPDETRYNPDAVAPNVTEADFTLPKPVDDVSFNPNMSDSAPAVHEDVRSLYSYD